MADQVIELKRRAAARQRPAMTERGEVTRRHILEVAAAFFAEHGYAGTSLNDVIRDAGVTKGAFYFHFPSKEALALQVLRYKQEQWAGRIVSATMRHPRAVDQLAGMVEALCDLHEQDPTAKALGRLCIELSDDPDLAPELTGQFTTWIELTASLISKAQQEGDVRPDIDPDLTGEVAVAAFLGAELMSKMLSGGSDLRERTSRARAFFVAAMQADLS